MVANLKPVTIEAFDALVFLPENAERRLEFVGGEIVDLLPNNQSSRMGVHIGGRLGAFVEDHELGWVTGADGGYVVGECRRRLKTMRLDCAAGSGLKTTLTRLKYSSIDVHVYDQNC